MSYPGNEALAPETRERIVTTYNQTLGLAQEGRLQEATLGCDFILKLDPLFEPARSLLTELEGSTGPVDLNALGLASLTVAVEPPPAPAAPVAPAEPAPAPPSDVGATATLDTVDAPLPPAIDLQLDAEPEADDASGRIGQMLAEGDRAFDRGEYQTAIDAWSRIFLIDIDHREAGERIERARRLAAERDRELDELYHEAMSQRDAGDLESARELLGRVLELQPDHLAAREALEVLDRAPEQLPDISDLPAEPEAPGPMDEALLDEDLPDLADQGSLLTESPSSSSAAGKRKRKTKAKRSPLLPGLLGLVVLGGGAWLLIQNWSSWFPNSEEALPVATAPPIGPIQRANRIHQSGDTAGAMELLRNLPQGHPDYERAQTMLEQWSRTEEESDPIEDAADPDAPSEGSLERAALLERARKAYSEAEYLRAAKAFAAASKLAPLEGASVDLYEDTRQRLLPIAQQMNLFRQREWERLLPTLWRKKEEDPNDRDTVRLLVDSYFNLGIRELRRGAADAAFDYLLEASQLDPEDPETERLLHFAAAYSVTPRDFLYRIFVEKLRYRS